MLSLALALFSVAVLLGIAISIWFLAGKPVPSRAIAIVHGLLGVLGLSALILVLTHGIGMGDRYGTASFGPLAAILAAVAALVGVGMALLMRKTTRNAGVLISVHATLAISAYVLLLAYVLLP